MFLFSIYFAATTNHPIRSWLFDDVYSDNCVGITGGKLQCLELAPAYLINRMLMPYIACVAILTTLN